MEDKQVQEMKQHEEKYQRVIGMVDDILYTLSFEELEVELRKIGTYNCVTFKSLED